MKRSASVRYAGVTKKMRPSPTLQETSTDERMATRLPAEVLLDIVHSVDFNTLGALRFASRTFRSIVQTNADVLAKRRHMELVIDDGTLTLCDGETDVELDCDPSMPFTYVTAMRRVASHVGFHSLTSLYIHDDWRRLPLDRLFDAAPALRFVETLEICLTDRYSSRFTSVDDVNRFTRQFPRLRRLRLYAPGKPMFDWSAFLRSEGALELPELVAVFDFRTKDGTSVPREFDFLRYCFDCTRLTEGVSKFVKVPFRIDASRSFLVTSLRGIARADRTITVQFRMSGEPKLSTEKFSTVQMEQDQRTVTRYNSQNSSVCVYHEDAFFTVTNDPLFDPFAVVY